MAVLEAILTPAIKDEEESSNPPIDMDTGKHSKSSITASFLVLKVTVLLHSLVAKVDDMPETE